MQALFMGVLSVYHYDSIKFHYENSEMAGCIFLNNNSRPRFSASAETPNLFPFHRYGLVGRDGGIQYVERKIIGALTLALTNSSIWT